METIDVWAQQVGPRMAQEPWLATLLRWTGKSSDDMAPGIDHTLARMDAAGVDLALLSAWYGPGGALITNDEVRAAIDHAPNRFRGLLGVDLRDPVGAARTIRELAGDTFVGVRVVPWLWELPPDHRLYYPVYTACVEAGVPLCTQIGHTGPLKTSETGRPIPYLERVLLDFPDLVVVGGHVGFPWLGEVATLTVKFPNFYVDSSAYALDRLPPEFLDYARTLGRRRVMFGTNWPMIDPVRALRNQENLGFDDDLRADFFGGTARQVFRLPDPRAVEVRS
ncbi:amidohydrolase family protein [Nocardia australiensis]|uniref:amidohydrolase family protein n=1 Tax=Nocardia australiensis TaxID=2887191 RepID=UPI001D143AEC|nr:amidohydrolase family protein [Nocardia australiensis]